MPAGTPKVSLFGGISIVPGGNQTFNSPGTFTVPVGVTKINLSGKGAAGNAGNPGNPGNSGTAGNPGLGGGGGGGGGSRVKINANFNCQGIIFNSPCVCSHPGKGGAGGGGASGGNKGCPSISPPVWVNAYQSPELLETLELQGRLALLEIQERLGIQVRPQQDFVKLFLAGQVVMEEMQGRLEMQG